MEMFVISICIVFSSVFLIYYFKKKKGVKLASPTHGSASNFGSCAGCNGNCTCKQK